MKRKTIAVMLIAGLIVTAVFVGTAAANGGAEIYGSRSFGDFEKRHNFTTTDNLYGWGDFGGYSYTYEDPPCPGPEGCGGRIYVVEHQETWVNGTNLTDVSSDGFDTVAWGDNYYRMAWPTPLTPGTYDLILDLNVSGHYHVWTHIPNPYSGLPNITDPIWVINVTGNSGISIDKTASINGTCPGNDPLTANISDTVTYCFNVTNTGEETLTNVTAIDDVYGAVPLGTTTLGPGNSTGGTITHVVNESDIPQVINNVTVTGKDLSGETVTDTESCTVFIEFTPGLNIEKTASTNGACPGSHQLNARIGDNVTYCFNVTNTTFIVGFFSESDSLR